jgi:imidazole glycerol-phosphate synthase subunit HisH
MKQPNVAVIDYGMGNLLSVRRGLEHCGAIVTVTSDPDVIFSASRVLLPGVGAFADAMAELCRLGLDDVVREVCARGTPLMGICLGMQMLLDESDEFGKTAGLGLIPGRVIPLPTTTITGQVQKVPHIGWNELELSQGRKDWKGTLLQDLKSGDAVYFVHSFMASPKKSDDRIADCIYGEGLITAVIGRDNVNGCQFHPEKSGEVGLKVLKRFLLL